MKDSRISEKKIKEWVKYVLKSSEEVPKEFKDSGSQYAFKSGYFQGVLRSLETNPKLVIESRLKEHYDYKKYMKSLGEKIV